MTETLVLRRTIGSWSGGTRVQVLSEQRGELEVVPMIEGARSFTVTADDLVTRRPKHPRPKDEDEK